MALAPGAAYGPAKRWEIDRSGTLARNLRERVDGPRVVVGGESERALGSELSGTGALDLTGRTDLLQAVAVLSRCAALVSNDSGALHLGAGRGHPGGRDLRILLPGVDGTGARRGNRDLARSVLQPVFSKKLSPHRGRGIWPVFAGSRWARSWKR